MRALMRLSAWFVLAISCARSIPPATDSYQVLLSRADTLASYCRWNDAVSTLWQAVSAAPQEIEPWLRLGDSMNRSGDARGALAHWDRILAVRPQEEKARVGRWHALLTLVQQGAGDSLRTVVRREVDSLATVSPRTPTNLELVLLGYRTLGEDSLAALWGSVLAFRYPESRLSFDITMESYYDSLYPVWTDNPGKIRFLRRYVEENLESVMRPEAYATLATALASTHRLPELTQLLRDWIREMPDDPRALATAAYWYLEKSLGDYRALQYGRRAVDAVADFPCPLGYPPERWEMEACAIKSLSEVSYARALLRWGDVETAARMAAEAASDPLNRLRCEATTAPANYVLAQCELAAGRLADAGKALSRALESGDTRNVWTARADSLLRVVLSRMHSAEPPLEYARVALSYDGPVFEDVTVPAGLAGVTGGRVAWGDYDNDGLDDLLIAGTRLFRNRGGGEFEDVTATTALAGLVASGGLLADMDNDGRLDLLAAGAGGRSGDRLFLFDGSTFNPAERFPSDSLPTEGVGLADFDRDGFLDVYLAKYEQPGSLGAGTPDRLLMNRGQGVFVDETESRGLLEVTPRAGRGVACADYDNDGDMDIFVSNYRLQPNFLWDNDGTGRFTEVACARGVQGVEHDGWFGHTIGSDWGDFDGDGDLDLVSANLAHPRYIHFSNRTMVLRNDRESGRFVDVSDALSVPYEETFSDPCWADVDNDGDLDLYITSIYEGRRSYLLLSDGGHFRDVSYLAGVRALNTWGCAAADMDNDGDLDLAVGSADGVRLFRNDTQGLAIRVVGVGNGTTTNTGCIGCRIAVVDDRGRQVREVQGGKGTTTQNSLVQHFGLGRASSYYDVQVTFTDGEVRTIPGVTPNQTVCAFQ